LRGLVESVFVGGVEEGCDVFGGDAELDVVDVVEYVSAVGLEYLDVSSDVLFDLFGGGDGQYVLGVYCSAPEGEVSAESLLQFPRVHVFGADLDGV